MTPPRTSRTRRRIGPFLGAVCGAALFGVACWAVFSQRATLQSSFTAIGEAHPLWIVLLLALPLANVFFTSATFGVLTNRYGKVPLWEMNLLMLSAGLLNYLPLRPGLVGRVAYHRQVHGIRATDSAKVVLISIGCSSIGLAGVLVGAMGVAGLGLRGTPFAWPLAIAPGAACLVVGGILRAGGGHEKWWRFLVAAGWRTGDMLVWTARYWLVFFLVGQTVTWFEAALLTVVSQAAMMVPLFGNGLGLREWAIGASVGGIVHRPSDGIDSGSDLMDMAAPGLTADLVNRAAELIVLAPLGAVAGVMLARRTKAYRQKVQPPAELTDTQEQAQAQKHAVDHEQAVAQDRMEQGEGRDGV